MNYAEATAKLNYPCPHCGRPVLTHDLAETIFCANEGKITAAQNEVIQAQLFTKLEQALVELKNNPELATEIDRAFEPASPIGRHLQEENHV
jgi:hypothetical protein